MTDIYYDDTIAARATPAGEGAIAVIRVSGANAITVVDSIFRGKAKLTEVAGFTVHYGRIVADEKSIDNVLATVFRSPHSYTGEDSVEVSCHGGVYVSQLVLDSVISAGARHAKPGEFSKRAFLNGKMDLSQAEAVADLISAKSEMLYRTSMGQLEGKFSSQIRALRKSLMDICSLVELQLDFSEEGLDLDPKKDILDRIESTKAKIEEMINSYKTGKVYRAGVSVVIVGRPNAGKSSLFNALLREPRAIVAEVPGTTRDSLEESVSIGGILFRFFDTAGLTETADPVESEGIQRAKNLVRQADVLLFVIDSTAVGENGGSLLDGVEVPGIILAAYNKIDLLAEGTNQPEVTFHGTPIKVVHVSARTGVGLEDLRKTLYDAVADPRLDIEGIHCTNSRHLSSLQQASGSLSVAYLALKNGASGEFIALDLRQATDHLAGIIGDVSNENMLNNIFNAFCIGK